jgi:transmembrane sensor
MRNDPETPDHSDRSIDWEALARFLAGESSAAESERIARWLTEHKADAELLAALDNAMSGLALRDIPGVDVEGALARVAARRDEAPTARPRVLPFARRRAAAWRGVALIAAAAAVVFAARVVLERNAGARATSVAVTSAPRTFATDVGKRDSVRLPDGGRVILGPASQLIVAAGYGQRTRSVELHGEAYFEVVHDTTHPFLVQAGDVTVRDVGTTFAVRNDSGTRVQVVVTGGSVMLRSGADSGALLAAGDVGTVQASGHVLTEHGASTAGYLAWMRDSLVFREAPLTEVSNDLRRWYGVSLRVDDSALARRHLTMTFSGDPLDRVLRVIGLGLGADIERHGDTAIVRPSTRGARPQ